MYVKHVPLSKNKIFFFLCAIPWLKDQSCILLCSTKFENSGHKHCCCTSWAFWYNGYNPALFCLPEHYLSFPSTNSRCPKTLNAIIMDNCPKLNILSRDVLAFHSGNDYMKFLLQILGQCSLAEIFCRLLPVQSHPKAVTQNNWKEDISNVESNLNRISVEVLWITHGPSKDQLANYNRNSRSDLWYF